MPQPSAPQAAPTNAHPTASPEDVARMIASTPSPITGAGAGLQVPNVQYGVVGSVGAGSVGLTIGGSNQQVGGVRHLGSYNPNIGDVVLTLHTGSDMVVLGTLASTQA